MTPVRLGRAKEAEEALRGGGSAAQTPRGFRRGGATPGSVPASARCSRRGARGQLLAAAAPAGHGRGRHARTSPRSTPALHAMSGAVAKEFVVALQREVAARAAPARVAEMHAASGSCAGGRSASLSGCGRTGRSAWTRLPATRRTCARRRRGPVGVSRDRTPRLRARPRHRPSRLCARTPPRNAHAARADARRRARAWRARWIPGLKTSRTQLSRSPPRRRGKWRNKSVASAFGSWRRVAPRGGATAPSPPSRARIAALAPAFRRWLEAWRASRALIRAPTRMQFEALLRRALARAFDAWFDQRENAREKKAGRVRDRAAAHPAGNRREKRLFLGWAASGETAATARARASSARARASTSATGVSRGGARSRSVTPSGVIS